MFRNKTRLIFSISQAIQSSKHFSPFFDVFYSKNNILAVSGKEGASNQYNRYGRTLFSFIFQIFLFIFVFVFFLYSHIIVVFLILYWFDVIHFFSPDFWMCFIDFLDSTNLSHILENHWLIIGRITKWSKWNKFKLTCSTECHSAKNQINNVLCTQSLLIILL